MATASLYHRTGATGRPYEDAFTELEREAALQAESDYDPYLPGTGPAEFDYVAKAPGPPVIESRGQMATLPAPTPARTGAPAPYTAPAVSPAVHPRNSEDRPLFRKGFDETEQDYLKRAKGRDTARMASGIATTLGSVADLFLTKGRNVSQLQASEAAYQQSALERADRYRQLAAQRRRELEQGQRQAAEMRRLAGERQYERGRQEKADVRAEQEHQAKLAEHGAALAEKERLSQPANEAQIAALKGLGLPVEQMPGITQGDVRTLQEQGMEAFLQAQRDKAQNEAAEKRARILAGNRRALAEMREDPLVPMTPGMQAALAGDVPPEVAARTLAQEAAEASDPRTQKALIGQAEKMRSIAASKETATTKGEAEKGKFEIALRKELEPHESLERSFAGLEQGMKAVEPGRWKKLMLASKVPGGTLVLSDEDKLLLARLERMKSKFMKELSGAAVGEGEVKRIEAGMGAAWDAGPNVLRDFIASERAELRARQARIRDSYGSVLGERAQPKAASEAPKAAPKAKRLLREEVQRSKSGKTRTVRFYSDGSQEVVGA